MTKDYQRIRSFNKRVLNPLMLKFAGKTRGPLAVIRHVGRRSGKLYQTPIIVEPMNDDFVIALTYGPQVDWYRNIQAMGQCTMLWHGKEYTIKQPEPLDSSIALLAFPRPLRPILRIRGTQDFVKMHRVEIF